MTLSNSIKKNFHTKWLGIILIIAAIYLTLPSFGIHINFKTSYLIPITIGLIGLYLIKRYQQKKKLWLLFLAICLLIISSIQILNTLINKNQTAIQILAIPISITITLWIIWYFFFHKPLLLTITKISSAITTILIIYHFFPNLLLPFILLSSGFYIITRSTAAPNTPSSTDLLIQELQNKKK